MTLASKLLEIHSCLDAAGIPHAFGGAIALAYCTGEPRGTIDLDINLFVGVERSEEIFAAMPEGVTVTSAQRKQLEREEQGRIWWDETPLDLFFSYHPFHEEIAKRVRTVRFEGASIPILSCTDLVVFKTLFGRTKDWADIEAAAANGSVNRRKAVADVAEMLGASDEATLRLKELLRSGPRTRDRTDVLRRRDR